MPVDGGPPAEANLASCLGPLVEPGLAGLESELAALVGLSTDERAVIRGGAARALYETVYRKVSRVLVLELNAMRITGRLASTDSAARWREFVDMAGTARFWTDLDQHYPPLRARLHAIVRARCGAAATLARRLATDRAALRALTGAEPGHVCEVSFGAGDSHRGGQAVALMRLTGGTVVYKPRSVHVDAALETLLGKLLGADPQGRIRVPAVLAHQDGYGWSEHIAHRYCANPTEIATFYRRIGHWLAVMGLLGGSDLHAENVIACGPTPVVIDCETLFTPTLPAPPSGMGLAIDRASRLVSTTVLRTGMLPSRGQSLGWRGVDISSAGALPGQQPVTDGPVIMDAGSDRARIGFAPVQWTPTASHPSPAPALADHWDQVLVGFDEATGMLRRADRDGGLDALLAGFAGCPVRMVLRASEAYAEVARMLWHPVSLHRPQPAAEQATRLLSDMARTLPGAPSDHEVIAAEIADLHEGDIPYFSTTPEYGRLTGPRGTAWLPPRDLIAAALADWRGADPHLDRDVIKAALVSAYLNDGWMRPEGRLSGGPTTQPHDDRDRQRRALAAGLVRELRDAAIPAEDGTVTWIAPVLGLTGWAVQPLNPDLYSGMAGVAVLLAAYAQESRESRADPVEGIDKLLKATLTTMCRIEDRRPASPGTQARPRPPGGYVGIGSQIWTWLVLRRLGAAGPEALDRARALAEQLPDAIVASDQFELLAGVAGAIVPLLQLAEATGEQRWTEVATAAAQRLTDTAHREGGTARWPSHRWPDGLGGCAHGATGIGWALARLALATGDIPARDTATAAFAFEESLYDQDAGSWRDLRQDDQTATAWCHGGVGIGLLSADLAARGWPVAPDLLDRAAHATNRLGFGWNHTLCHGDAGCWELMTSALTGGYTSGGTDRAELDDRLLTSLERHGPVTGLARDAYAPGLLPGQGGIAYQLLRMHNTARLPSVLTLGDP